MNLVSSQHVQIDLKKRKEELIKDAEDGKYQLDLIEDE
jgi:hypothetical protein